MDKYNFQYCPKVVVVSKDETEVLLCKRKGENDYDGTFSFAGGKMEITDQSITEGVRREKNEELGENFKVKLFQTFNLNILFRKKDGNAMILPYYFAIHQEGEVELNHDEYSEYKWVKISELEKFEPKIQNIPEIVDQIIRLEKIAEDKDFVVI